MIYTVTLNPYLERVINVEELVYDDANRIDNEIRQAGGKGIDVSRVIRELGGQSIALGFIGGYNGIEIEGRLVNEGIICDFTRINAESKTNTVIYQRRTKMQTLLTAPDPEIDSIELSTLFNKIRKIPRNNFVVISGNMPTGLDDNFYAQIIIALKEKGAKVILDADGASFRKGTEAGPFMIKPNIHEFGRLVDQNLVNFDEIIRCANQYKNIVEYIIVSMGAKGVVGISGEGSFVAAPPKMKAKSSAGAGDSLVAGLIFALQEGKSLRDALLLGVACGAASTLKPGNELCTKEEIDSVRKEVIINKI